jgi:hypothetical protein
LAVGGLINVAHNINAFQRICYDEELESIIVGYKETQLFFFVLLNAINQLPQANLIRIGALADKTW